MSNIHGLGSFGNSSGGGGNSGAGGGGGQPPSCGERMKQMWAGIPLFNKFLLISCILVFILTCLPLGVGAWLVLAPYFLESFQGKSIS